MKKKCKKKVFSAGIELETMDGTMSFSILVLVNYVIAPPVVIEGAPKA